jgi:hypothetical protein
MGRADGRHSGKNTRRLQDGLPEMVRMGEKSSGMSIRDLQGEFVKRVVGTYGTREGSCP